MASQKATVLDQILELGWFVAIFFALKSFGLLYGIIGVTVIWQVYIRSMKHFFGLEHLSGMDAFWFHDDETNNANIIAFLRMQRFNSEDFKDQIFRKLIQFSRNRSKVVKCLGTYWFKDMSVEEMYKQRDKLVRNETGIHNERQLANFMEKQQSIRDEFDNVQWRAFLIEDYSDTESVFVYKVHHCVADGISSILMCANLTDKPDVKTFPYMALRFAFWQRALINLTVPLMIGFISVQQLFCWRYERNGIKSARIEGSMSGLKSFALAKDIPLDYVKAKCGDLGVTLNEFIFGIISQTMKQCLEFHDDRETKSIRLAMPFSLRPTPKHELDFRPCNDFAILPVQMRLVEDLSSEIKQIQKDLAYLKTSPIPFGWYYTAAFALLLPYSIAHYLTSDLAHKLTMGFSNVPGSKENWVITGKRCNSLGFVMPTGKTVVMGWGAITHGNTLKISVGADRAAVQDTEWLIRQFEKNLDNFLKSKDWRNYDANSI